MSNVDVSAPPRRPFAAKYAHPGWGVTLIIVGALSTIGVASGSIPSFIVGLALIAWGIYLVRGRGLTPAKATALARVRDEQQAARMLLPAVVLPSIETAATALAVAPPGAASFIAYRNVVETVRFFTPATADQTIAAVLTSTGYDAHAVPPPLGAFPAITPPATVEVFASWIIVGQYGYDFERGTRVDVFVDGNVAVSTHLVAKGRRTQQVTQEHDLRRATVQFTSPSWSFTAEIPIAALSTARELAARLNAVLAQAEPQAATLDDMQSLVERIVASNEQPIEEKIRQLSNLRFERLLSDAEFEHAKARLLSSAVEESQ